MKFKDYTEVQALINSNIEVNAMILPYVAVLRLRICLTDIGAQKVDWSIFLTYGMMITNFQFEDKKRKICFFQKTFLMANTAIEIVLKIPILTFSQMEINFVDREFN